MTSPDTTPNLPEWLQLAQRYAAEVEYGQITVTLHQGQVVEVQKTERTRFSSGPVTGPTAHRPRGGSIPNR